MVIAPNDIRPVMFSQLHNHYSKISDELPAMRENLAVLCRTWYIEETCIISTYAEKYGEAANIFYVGLLNYTKKALYGSDMSRLALCSRSVVKKLMKGQLKHQADAGFNGYITKQYRSWKATGWCELHNCSFDLTVSLRL
ncbi:hypothetical protein LSH36_338g07023 [Paralvinella palmiformis]|uniref:Uncharacterized protein n=1 Tax=Paralvinella palmiformis TaxID=53620 RepID=A0AAD9JFV7_9ANNE|nr:hypothetical protein LSH36_338g07023 [Paralvinella palmiformis]